MSVLENFKNIPRSPYGGRQGSNVIFFLQICNEVPGEKKEGGLSPPNGRQAPVAHPRGDRPLSPVEGATGSPVSLMQIGTIASVLFFFRKLMQIGTIASVLFFSKIHYSDAFFFICSSLLVRLLCNF